MKLILYAAVSAVFTLYLVWGSIWIKGQYYDASLYMELALSLINDQGNFSLSNFPQVFRGANFAVILQLFHLLLGGIIANKNAIFCLAACMGFCGSCLVFLK